LRAAGVTVAAAAVLLAVPSPALGQFSISDFTAGPASAPAGSHPDSSVSMTFGGTPSDDVKDIIQHFPAGIIPNPEALPRCSPAQLLADTCPTSSRLGPTSLTATPEPGVPVTVNGDVYNIEVDPPYVGGLGFVVRPAPGVHSSLSAPFTVRSARFDITTSLPDMAADINNQPIMPTARDYGLTGVSVSVPRQIDLSGLGAVPIKINNIQYALNGIAASTGEPYLTTTTACLQGYPMLEATAWDDPTNTRVNKVGNVLSGTDCDDDHVPFDPQPFDVGLETTQTDTPSGYDISINVPANETPRHQSYLNRTVLRLPEGTALSPPAGEGLEACTDAQLGFGTQDPPSCPAGSDVGDVVVVSKNVPDPLQGDLYLGEPTPGHTYRLFIAFPIVDGLWIKLDGETVPDPQTGRLTTTFDDLPMLPFEKFTISLNGGDHAVLVNPRDCGVHNLTSTLTPWSGATTFPTDKDKHPEGTFTASYDGSGGACPDPFPFTPTVSGFTTPTQAGAFSSLSMTLSNPDRNQLLRTLRASLPPGLVGGLTGVPLCPVANAAAGTCAEDTRIGTVGAAVGAGDSPLSLPGSIYIAKPLQAGDPASLAIVVPARVGPFDFGNVITRARIVVRPDVGLDVVLADDLPRIIEGIPIRLRSVDVTVDRANFTRNPTSCAQLAFGASFTSFDEGQASASGPYQATGCDKLLFSPRLRFIATGELRKDGHPTLQAIVTQPAGEANIARSRVVLPDIMRPEVLALQRPGGLCPEALAAARSCPASSQVGVAKAVTPLLPDPLSGPVYIVQHAANPLPKLVVFLDGAVSIRLEAQNELQLLRVVNRFDTLPDVPLTRFELTIKGGKNGILRNYGNLCQKRVRGDVSFTAHSGKSVTDTPLIETPSCESSASSPRVSLSLRGVRGGNPVLSMRVRRAPGGAKLRAVTLKLPRSLRANPSRARAKALVKSSRKLRRSQWKLSRRGVLKIRKLPTGGKSSVTVVLGKGTLTPSAALRRKSGRAKRLTFKVKVTDVRGHRFSITRRISPRP
jgi:hypothetical protein